jgi:hypothetical protein
MARIASSLYEGQLEHLGPSQAFERVSEPALNVIKIKNNLASRVNNNHRTPEEWGNVFPNAAFFEGQDPKLGLILIMVYEDPDSSKISTVLFSALGELCTDSITLDHRSRFFASCENLRPEMRGSNVRRALAITLLRAYSMYSHADLSPILSNAPRHLDWDETTAGEIASNMKVITSKSPIELGSQLMSFGFLQPQFLNSTRLDVIYDDNPRVIDQNNKLVFLLGQQLEHLFDPLTEYSPESPEIQYTAPDIAPRQDSELLKSICKELFQLQESITQRLVQFLREVVIPVRIRALNGSFQNLSAANVNQIFPPTVDEITRVNCMFLEALKSALSLGGFEVMRACGMTIPYFYKAYMRHESAHTSFSSSLDEFLKFYGEYIPANYSPTKIESIMKVPMNLPKIKLILERLVSSGDWSSLEDRDVKKYYKGALDTIDSFGKDDLKPYTRRVFTPTGKLLTEICEGWPSMIAYGWLNRKVISVNDFKNDDSDGVIILFNDYIVFAEVDKFDTDDERATYRPRVSDVLMNSLINENPIKNVPNLKVLTWTNLNNIEVASLDNNHLKFVLKDDPELTLILQVNDATKLISLLNKAKILGKSTPFHLFKNEKFGLTIYVTAHEKSSYDREHSRSSIGLFLNIPVRKDLLKKYDMFAAMSAKFVDEDMIAIDGLTQDGEKFIHTIHSSELANFISEELSGLEVGRRSSHNPSLFSVLAANNRSLLKKSLLEECKAEKPLAIATRKNSLNSKRLSSLSSSNTNKPLPKIVDRDITPTSQLRKDPVKKQSKFKNRLSQFFGVRKKEPKVYPAVKKKAQMNTVQRKFVQGKSSASGVSSQRISAAPASEKEFLEDDQTPEVSTFDDCKTFESSMSAIFDDEEEQELNTKSLTGHNWTITRENSSVNCNLDKQWQLNRRDVERQSSVKKAIPLFGPERSTSVSTLITKTQKSESGVPEEPIRKFRIATPTEQIHLNFPGDQVEDCSLSLDCDFSSPILRVGIKDNEEMTNNDIDTFYTPKSHSTELARFEDNLELGGLGEDFDFDSFVEDDNQTPKFESHREILEDEPTQWSAAYNDDILLSKPGRCKSVSSEESSSFKSCLDEDQLKNMVVRQEELNEYEDKSLVHDESFKYLVGMLDNPVVDQVMRKSETLKSIPRSYSSYKYLASFIDSDLSMSSDLYNFLQERQN